MSTEALIEKYRGSDVVLFHLKSPLWRITFALIELLTLMFFFATMYLEITLLFAKNKQTRIEGNQLMLVVN